MIRRIPPDVVKKASGQFYNGAGELVDLLGDAAKRRPVSRAYRGTPGSGPEGETCGTCNEFVIREYHNRRYFKCGLIPMTNGAGTDIRKSSPACSFWAKTNEE